MAEQKVNGEHGVILAEMRALSAKIDVIKGVQSDMRPILDDTHDRMIKLDSEHTRVMQALWSPDGKSRMEAVETCINGIKEGVTRAWSLKLVLVTAVLSLVVGLLVNGIMRYEELAKLVIRR